jgi:hypothetical protein
MAAPEGEGNPATEIVKQLDASGAKSLPGLVGRLREDLLREAARLSGGGPISEDELRCAYERVSQADRLDDPVAEVQLVVSRALRENRMVERVSYAMAVVLFLYGLVLLSLGVAYADIGTRVGALVSGSLVELLILIPFRFAINSRRHNIAIRMVGYVLSFAKGDRKLAASLLKDTFGAIVLGKPPAP